MNIRKSAIYQKLMCPFISLTIQLTVLFAIYFMYGPTFSKVDKGVEYRISLLDASVSKGIGEILNKCGEDYFISWMTVFDEQRSYFFKDVAGCNTTLDGNCRFSVKDANLNSFYDQEHSLDPNSYQYIKSLLSGEIVNIRELNIGKYKSMKELITAMNLPMTKGVLTAIKRNESDVIYIFTLINTSENSSCNKKEMSRSLRELAKTARRGL